MLLAWDDVKKTARDLRDERNEVIHEFARQLDLEDGKRDGRPLLWDQFQHTAWARVMSREFFRLQIDGEGALARSMKDGDPGEVFATATELFLEMPHELLKRYPELYELLRSFFKLDPARWQKR